MNERLDRAVITLILVGEVAGYQREFFSRVVSGTRQPLITKLPNQFSNYNS